MTSLWFVVPAHGRAQLAQICLAQLRWTCDQLEHAGVRACAVVVSDDENLDTARELGFATYRQGNRFLSRKFNDGIQAALDPRFNPHPADYVVPCGSDDWVHPSLFTDLPADDTMIGFQRMSFVREDGRELTVRHLNYEGGSGIRIYPRQIMKTLSYRPADEHRTRGCDTSILVNLKRHTPIRVEHRDIDPLLLVDWKTNGENVTEYHQIAGRHRSELERDPFDVLAGRWPQESLDAMSAHYQATALVTA